MNSVELSNRDLVTRLRTAGPEDPVWPEFFSRFYVRIRTTTHRALTQAARRNPGLDMGDLKDLMEDLTQEVFIRLLEDERRAITRFKGRNENSIHTYLNAITVNIVRDYVKKLRAQRRPQVAASLDEPRKSNSPQELVELSTLADKIMSSDPGPEAAAAVGEFRMHVSNALDRFCRRSATRRDQLIFRLHFLEGLTVDEITTYQSVGLSQSGIEKRLAKIRSIVKKLLRLEGGQERKKSSL